MTERSHFGNDNTEYILGSLDDEDEISIDLSEDNIDNTQLIVPQQDSTSQSGCNEENSCEILKKTMNKILDIKLGVEKIKEEILMNDKEVLKRDFKKYEEQLILKTLSLDKLETKGKDTIRDARKEAILFVQECLNLLDSKIKS